MKVITRKTATRRSHNDIRSTMNNQRNQNQNGANQAGKPDREAYRDTAGFHVNVPVQKSNGQWTMDQKNFK